ncbi:MAG: hypothetical protein ABIH25_02025 [Candidatus Woesearchaeota archaeon]
MAKKGRTPWDKWSFNLAWILAVLLALGGSFGLAFTSGSWWPLILLILGLVVGFMHSLKDVTPMVLLVLAVAIFGTSSLALIPWLGIFVATAIAQFMAFLTPAALVIALRKVFEIMK